MVIAQMIESNNSCYMCFGCSRDCNGNVWSMYLIYRTVIASFMDQIGASRDEKNVDARKRCRSSTGNALRWS
jgi:succinate dehydrogenase/fumarate reductase-like Fe-S protein